MLGTKPPLVLVLRIREDLGDASLGGLLGGLLGWPLRRLRPHWRCATTATTRDFDCNVREGKTMRASSFLRTCFNNAIWEQPLFEVACHYKPYFLI